MALLFTSGWDIFGGINSVSANVAALLTAGEWTSTAGTAFQIAAPLSSTGFSLSMTNTGTVNKTLPASYGRLIGGIRVSSALAANGGIQLQDAGTAQVSVTINTTGTVSVRTGGFTGTALATSSVSISAGTTHYLEWDITLSNTGTFTVWVDGIAVIGGSSGVTGSGDTTATANSTANGLTIGGATGVNITFDDLYLLDSTGSAPLNAALLTSPRIETQFPSSDGAVQSAVGAAILGSSLSRNGTGLSTTANQFRVRAFTPVANCTVNSISMLPGATSAAIQLRPVIYADSSNAPGALLSAGSTVVGMTSGTAVTMPLTTPQSLVAGTRYWLGFMCDIAVTSGLTSFDGANNDRTATSTFASGAPGTAPATSLTLSATLWGNITVSANWPAISNNPAQGNYGYVYDATVGHEDLYSFPALSVTPSTIYNVAGKASVSKSDAGAKTVSVRCKSGTTDSAGTGGTQAPGTSFAWITSNFSTDPNTSGAWSKAALDAAQAGLRVES